MPHAVANRNKHAKRSQRKPQEKARFSLLERLQALPLFKNVYAPVFLSSLALVIYGCIVVASASLTIADASLSRQLIGVFLGVVLASIMWRYDYRGFSQMTTVLLVIYIVLFFLPMIPGFSYSAKGMTGWVQFPGTSLRFQPSELMKLVLIFYIAGVASKYQGAIETFKDYCLLCLHLGIPFVLLLTQDLGTSLVVLFSGACIIGCSGAKKEWIIPTVIALFIIAFLVVITSMIPGIPHILKDYQLKRLTVFIDPSVDPSGDGYNLQQATIAVGSGGFWGKGIGMATQAGQGFLPEAHTDFVFALLAEEFGFVGCTILLLLFACLIWSTLKLAKVTDSLFGRLVLIGIASMWLFQVFENIGMCLGIMPITGIPLPFISYGASSMVVQILAVGIVESVYKNRVKAG